MRFLFATGLLFLALTRTLSTAADKNPSSLKGKASKAAIADRSVSREESLPDLIRRVKASVVVIQQEGRRGGAPAIGSGFVLSADGLIATSLHVIGEGRPIQVRLANNRSYQVTEVHAWDRAVDLAILKIEAKDLVPLPLGNSDVLQQGTAVIALGSPQGLDQSVVQGIVSARRTIDEMEFIQLAIPIEPGNSGGPLVDHQGLVQGILTLKSAITANLGFAMPVNRLKPLLEKPNPTPIARWISLFGLDPDRWESELGGSWFMKGGRIQAHGLGAGLGGRALNWSRVAESNVPYEVSVSVKLDDERGAAGLIFGGRDASSHFGFYPSGGELRLTHFAGPDVFQWNILGQKPIPEYRPGEFNHLRVLVESNRVSCFVNGIPAIRAEIPEWPGHRIGLAKFRDTFAEFKAFKAGSPSGENETTGSAPGDLIELASKVTPESRSLEPLLALTKDQPQASALLEAEADRLAREAVELRRVARRLHQDQIGRRLELLLAQPGDQTNLFRAALLVSSLDNPELELSPYEDQLNRMAGEVSEKISGLTSVSERVRALRDYLFKESGFHGSRADYSNRANSYMNDVMDDREGLPITLSVLFLELARLCGVTEVKGAALPGRFMVQWQVGEETRFLDVFQGGNELSVQAVEALVMGPSGGSLKPQHLQPPTAREIVARMLHNLLGVSVQSADTLQVMGYLDVLVRISPEDVEARWTRGMIRARMGDRPSAREDLTWILEKQPEGLPTEELERILRDL